MDSIRLKGCDPRRMIKNKKFMISLTLGLILLIIAGWSDQHIQSQQVTKFNELEEKIQRLEDIEQIKQLKARYFRFVDEKKWTAFGRSAAWN